MPGQPNRPQRELFLSGPTRRRLPTRTVDLGTGVTEIADQQNVPTSPTRLLKRGRSSDDSFEEGEIREGGHADKLRRTDLDTSIEDAKQAQRLSMPPPASTMPAHLRARINNLNVVSPVRSQQIPNSAPVRSGPSGLMYPFGPRLTQAQLVPGDIIIAPHHCTACDPKADPVNNPSFTQTSIAVVASKMRYMIVMWAYEDCVFVLPATSRSGRGLQGLQGAAVNYVCLRDPLDKRPVDPGPHRPLDITRFPGGTRKPSIVRLTNVYTVDFAEHIEKIGHISRGSIRKLHELWLNRAEEAAKVGFANDT